MRNRGTCWPASITGELTPPSTEANGIHMHTNQVILNLEYEDGPVSLLCKFCQEFGNLLASVFYRNHAQMLGNLVCF